MISGCSLVKPVPISSVPVQRKGTLLKNLCTRHKISCQWDTLSQIVTLKLHDRSAKILVGSPLVLMEKDIVRLNAPIKMIHSALEVGDDFQSKVIKHMIKKSEQKIDYSFKKIRSIIIDAGHGGKDPGAIGRSGMKEKKVVLDISKRLQKILRQNGLKVHMTRNQDKFITLQRRTELASQTQADLFISVHANSNPARRIHGLEVYTLKNLQPKDQRSIQRKANLKRRLNRVSMKKNSSRLDRIIEDMLYTHKQTQSIIFANKVAKKSTKITKTKNLGSKLSNFYVLKNTLIPAILVEVGFLSNPKEERLLNTRAYRQKIANGLAIGILDYIRK